MEDRVRKQTVARAVGGVEAHVVGAEADLGTSTAMTYNTDPGADFKFNMNYIATFRGRAGYAMDRTLLYVTAGGAYAQGNINGINFPVPNNLHADSWGWSVGAGVAIMVAIGLVLLFLLTQATDNRQMYEQNYAHLFVLNVVVAGLLLLVIGWIAVRLFSRLKRGRFGSRLLVKLAAVFALAGFAPGLLIYVVSYQFVSRSIESWFDVKVEGALEAGLNLGRVTLDTLASDLANKSRSAASQLIEVSDVAVGLSLDRMREQAVRIGPATLTRYAEVVQAGLGEMRGATAPRCRRMPLPRWPAGTRIAPHAARPSCPGQERPPRRVGHAAALPAVSVAEAPA